ncbi:MAG: pilus assembly protein PilE [Xanthomonadales bacterium]|nr:pilus assembly protein PilE [Xanthomonadales bacterium]
MGKGLPLSNLLIVVAIIAVITAVALPSYDRYGQRARRTGRSRTMMRVAAAQERFTTANRYITDVTAGLGLGTNSEKGYYSIAAAFVGGSDQTYVLTATPQGAQANDACHELTINNTGLKAAPSDTGTNGACW